MTKILVFSDNHRDRSVLKEVLNRETGCDFLFSLGDSEMPEHELSYAGIVGVKGNYPFEPDFPYDLILEFSGVRFMFTHGHRYYVKTGTGILLEKAISEKIDVVFYGHTHEASIEYRNKVLLVNPGALSFSKGKYGKTYLIANVENKKVYVSLREAETGEEVENREITFKKGDE
ncbi:MAG TPA: metallophosphoesterase [Bacillota bacterium]|nr:metallophosphoesterase [Bacillota bacterium]HPF42874.1 metallophosphoesterase [Bacillota bacterium]HPJ85373.1 metallophosphoesterase [Bacillota bacterium]HPQ61331.1 metallophosphoesterase [Bacillota bacterium]HRX91422.1 metallophosphoesterase [Candidatus Izemoplasmatales bacterium]